MRRHRMRWKGTASESLSRWRRGVLILTVALLIATGQVTGAWAAAAYEQQPVLRASDLVPAELLRGEDVRVEEKVPTDGFLAHFTIHSDVGTFKANGLDMLRIRSAELSALEQLEGASQTDTFPKARAARRNAP